VNTLPLSHPTIRCYHTVSRWICLQSPVTRKRTPFHQASMMVISLGSLNLFLQLYLYSSKLEHIHSLKLFVYVTADGLIAFRSSIFGGGSREPEGHEQVVHSPEFKKFMEEHPYTKVIAFLDRGFTRTTEHGSDRVFLLFPTSGEKSASHLSPSHAAWRQVCAHTSFHVGLMSAVVQWVACFGRVRIPRQEHRSILEP
jgi:hypothetical protein